MKDEYLRRFPLKETEGPGRTRLLIWGIADSMPPSVVRVIALSLTLVIKQIFLMTKVMPLVI